jgi:hypothetical protein
LTDKKDGIDRNITKYRGEWMTLSCGALEADKERMKYEKSGQKFAQ